MVVSDEGVTPQSFSFSLVVYRQLHLIVENEISPDSYAIGVLTVIFHPYFCQHKELNRYHTLMTMNLILSNQLVRHVISFR